MEKKTDSLLFKFAIIFAIFSFVTLLMSGFNIYYNQTNAYKQQCEDNIQHLAAYLKELVLADGENFVNFQEYFLAHHEEINVPFDFNGDYQPEQKKFEQLFDVQNPGKTLGVDIKFSELSDEVKLAYTTYRFEYWLNIFEKARDSFGIKYAYYIVPTGEYLHMYWMIDAIREEKVVNGVKYLHLCEDVPEVLEKHQKMWEAWNTGEIPKGYDTYDNQYGKTYAYYMPLIINGQKMGLIGTEVEIEAVNREIFNRTLNQSIGMAAILFVCVAALLWFINDRYISKLAHLQLSVREYSQIKDPAIAGAIESDAIGHDEIAALAQQVAAMILELENYMTSLIETADEFSSANRHAHNLHKLAHRDALTGIRNKTAYDADIRRIEWQMADGYAHYGVAMIDLNFLKRINDTYGHEYGNAAIMKLCDIVCKIFVHSSVSRIGGDEFVVIIEHEDYNNINELVDEFTTKLEELKNNDTLEQWEKVSAAIGVALYDPEVDTSFANVFKRADKLMYQNKKEMKAMRTD